MVQLWLSCDLILLYLTQHPGWDAQPKPSVIRPVQVKNWPANIAWKLLYNLDVIWSEPNPVFERSGMSFVYNLSCLIIVHYKTWKVCYLLRESLWETLPKMCLRAENNFPKAMWFFEFWAWIFYFSWNSASSWWTFFATQVFIDPYWANKINLTTLCLTQVALTPSGQLKLVW